jgi:2'-hydroxyisoflavone reductase
MTTRRDFLRTSAAAGGALLAAGSPSLARAAEQFARDARDRIPAPMNILILGGTGFIGPHIVRRAVSRGHKVTIFTRGRKDGNLPEGVERLIGDRMINDTIPQGNLKSLEGRKWDAVIDDPASDPRWVKQSSELLKASGSYTFVSSTGVFLPYLTANNDENAPVVLEPAPGKQADYGIQKAQSEVQVMNVFGDRGIVVRPGYICGPGDVSDRFSYWPQRLAQGGEMLVPGKKTDPSQFIDVRDLAAFMIKLVEERRSGRYNCTGPATAIGFGTFIEEAHAALKSEAKLVWVDDYAFLRENRITYAIPWMIPEGENAYHLGINNKKAVAAGLTFRPIADTVRDTLATWPARLAALAPGAQPNFRWMMPEKEVQVLAAWKAKQG